MANVKPGDLAVIIGTKLGNAGRIVRVLREGIPGDRLPGRPKGVGPLGEEARRPVWVVESQGSPLNCRSVSGKVKCQSAVKFVYDGALRRIVDTDQPDEMLAIAVPVQFLPAVIVVTRRDKETTE